MALRVDMPRELSQQATQTQSTLLILMALIGFSLIALTLYLLKAIVLDRLERLDDDVRRIGRNANTKERLKEEGNDELSNLASSINRMLTALSSSEADLVRSKQRYEAVVQDQTELVLRTTPDLRVTFVNRAFCSFFLADRIGVIGQVFPPPMAGVDGTALPALISHLSLEEPVAELEQKVAAGDSERRWLQWSIRGIFDEDEQLSEVQWVGRDVTERMRMLDKLNQSEKIESLGVLAGGIAHDFNNMLTSILGTITMMKRPLAVSDPRVKRLEESERMVMRATELTKQLLTFSRGGEPIKKHISLPRFAQETAQFALRGSDLMLQEDLDPRTRQIEADEGQLFQVVSNLVLNARQAMPRSGRVSLRCGNIHITSESASPLKPGEYVFLDVEDDGVGIPRQNLQKIFDPYFSTKPNGNGLGLTIVHSIVSRHGGLVDVESEEGRGSRFRVILPSIDHVEQKDEETEEVGQVSGRILLMDDEESILEVTGMLLREYGYEVECAHNGEEALQRLKEALAGGSPFDLAILDLTIRGGMGGKEAVKHLKTAQGNLATVVSSGYSNDPVMANFRDYGFDAVVQKPYRIMDMVLTIEELRARRPEPSSGGDLTTWTNGVRIEL
jgi:PAS domain S-box-containing protein